jgi:hypothetical protein
METTITNTIPMWTLGTVMTRVEEMNVRIAKRELGSPVTLTVGDSMISIDQETRAETTYVDVTLTFTPVVMAGGYTLSAIADYTSTDTALVFDLAETGLTADDFDPTRCDYCGTARDRNRVFAVTAADGTMKFVGTTCVKDFLGVDPAGLLYVADAFASVFDDDDGYSGCTSAMMVPPIDFITYAQAVISVGGYVKTSDPGCTRDVVLDFIYQPTDADFEDCLAALNDPATGAFAADAIAWAAAKVPDDTTSDFDRNMYAVATSEMLGRKAFGIAAYLPVAYGRYLDREAAKAAEAAAAGPVEDVPTGDGRTVVSGVIVGLKTVESQWGTAYKMIVRDDRGFRIYVTQPDAIGWAVRGDRVTFTARLTPSDDDPTFGFGSRPTKASTEPAVAAEVATEQVAV